MSRMDFELTEGHVSEILHMKDASEWHAAMLEMFPEYDITTRNRNQRSGTSAFLPQ